jgi:hypothetical protein
LGVKAEFMRISTRSFRIGDDAHLMGKSCIFLSDFEELKLEDFDNVSVIFRCLAHVSNEKISTNFNLFCLFDLNCTSSEFSFS